MPKQLGQDTSDLKCHTLVIALIRMKNTDRPPEAGALSRMGLNWGNLPLLPPPFPSLLGSNALPPPTCWCSAAEKSVWRSWTIERTRPTAKR